MSEMKLSTGNELSIDEDKAKTHLDLIISAFKLFPTDHNQSLVISAMVEYRTAYMNGRKR